MRNQYDGKCGRSRWVGLSAHTARALITGQVSAPIPNGKCVLQIITEYPSAGSCSTNRVVLFKKSLQIPKIRNPWAKGRIII